MPFSVTLPDELAGPVRLHEQELPDVIRLGLREWNARMDHGFTSLSGLLETLATLPTPEEVLALRPSAAVQSRIDELLEKNRGAGLSVEERREWEQYQYVEHLGRAQAERDLSVDEPDPRPRGPASAGARP